MSNYFIVAIQWCAGVAFCTIWRMVPFRPPNVEPILATMMPFGKRYGAISSMLFAAASMLIFDAITGNLTSWTAITAVTYGIIGACAGLVLDHRRGILQYVVFAVFATIFFDAVTGVAAGAILFGMSWKEGFIGQIPFTINHLIGNVILAAALTPIVDWLLVLTGAERQSAHAAII